MINLNKKEVEQLLRLINNLEERRAVKAFLKDLQKISKSKPMLARRDYQNLRTARKALDVITRIGLEFGKHVAIEEIIHFFK